MPRSPSEVGSLFQDVVKHLGASPLLQGFRKKGASFRRRVGCNQLLVSLQKSTSSSREGVTFVVNVGVACDALLRFHLEEEGSPEQLIHATCQWRARVGRPQERWFAVDDATDSGALAREVERELRPTLEEASALSTDAALVELWRSGAGSDLTDLETAENLAVLAARLGHDDALAEARRRLQGMADEDRTRVGVASFARKFERWLAANDRGARSSLAGSLAAVLGEVIAEWVVVFRRPDAQEVPGRIWFGRPVEVGKGEAACAVGIDGLHGGLPAIRGVNTVQALMLAVRLVGRLLREFQDGGGAVLDATGATLEEIDILEVTSQ